MSKIILADFTHKKELINLWLEAFDDGENFVKSFLDAYMIPEYNVPVVVEESGEISAALYLVDFELYSNTKLLGCCSYLFAAATKKEHRNKGYMSELIYYSEELCRNRGLKAIFLFPQNQKLFNFYSKTGFKTIYSAKKITRNSKTTSENNLSDLKLVNKDITDTKIFDNLYDSYVEFTAKQELSPMKDRLFYFKCASSYLNIPENSEIKAYFAVLENNVEKFCYVFYKKYKNTYYIDDIIIPEYGNTEENINKKDGKYNKTVELLSDFILNLGNDINLEITALPQNCTDGENIPLAMILPLSDTVSDITDNLKSDVYINMFMNI